MPPQRSYGIEYASKRGPRAMDKTTSIKPQDTTPFSVLLQRTVTQRFMFCSIVWFYLHRSTLVPALISDYIHYMVWGEITYPFINSNALCTIEDWEWIRDFQVKSNQVYCYTKNTNYITPYNEYNVALHLKYIFQLHLTQLKVQYSKGSRKPGWA